MSENIFLTSSLLNKDCCPRCVLRLLYDGNSSCKSAIINAENAVRESPICPFCCGLLHHPSLCTLPSDGATSNGVPNALCSIVEKIQSSNYEYSACQIRVIDPLALIIRDEVLWGLGSHTPESNEDQTSPKCEALLSARSNNLFHQNRLPAKVPWRWIVESQLSSVLKVPFVNSLQDLDSSKTQHMVCSMSNSLLVVEVELAYPQSEHEGRLFLEQACIANSANVRDQAFGVLNMKPARKHARRHRRGVRQCVTNSPIPSDASSLAGKFSKNKLQLLLSSLYDDVNKVHFSLPPPTTIPFLATLQLSRSSAIFLAGRYVKFSRRLPQTPWIVDNVRKLPSSVEELIILPLKEIFGQSTSFTFTGSGREDVDVRCLGLGRPFFLKIDNYEACLENIIRSFSDKYRSVSSKLEEATALLDDGSVATIDLLHLATLVNSRTEGKLFIRDLQVVSCSDASHAVKSGELEKAKCYVALCWCSHGGLDVQRLERLKEYCNQQSSAVLDVQKSRHHQAAEFDDEITKVWEFGPITLTQPTPIRALHRRSALERVRQIHHLRLTDYRTFMCNPPLEFNDYSSWCDIYPEEELFIAELRCEAGTYVKEFVHGDLGRTRPNLASIFQCQVDILALDVVAVELNWPPRLDDHQFSASN